MFKKYIKASLVVIFAAVTLCSCSNNSSKNSALQFYNLRGNVKSVKTLVYSTHTESGITVKGKLDMTAIIPIMPINISGKRVFLKNGSISEFTAYNFQGKPTNSQKFEYNFSGDLIKTKNFDANGKLISEDKTVTKTENGNKIVTTTLSNNPAILSITSIINKNNQLIEEKMEGKLNSFPICTAYKYNDKGNLISVITYNNKGKKIAATVFKLNKKGDASEAEMTGNADNNLGIFKIKYKYDSKGNWTQATVFNKGKAVIVERDIKYY